MANTASLIPELDDIIRHHSPEKRAETLSRLTTLFVDGSPRFNEDHVGLFDDVFGRLIVDVEPQVRSALSSRLAPIGNAPIAVSRRLAHDDIAIAEPVLRSSTRLAETDLVEIAQTKGQAHLLAISGRAGIGEAVTDILVERGDGAVMCNLADNHAARLSARGFSMLVARSDPDGVLAEKIGQRPDLPADLFCDLLMRAPEAVQRRLVTAAGPETRAEIRRALAGKDVGSRPARVDSDARQNMLVLHQAGQLGEPEIIDFAKAGQRDETVAALSVLCGVPTEVVDHLMAGERSDPVLILCKAAGFAWPCVEAILALRPKGTANHSIDAACANFERLAPSTARRVLRFWQARQDSAAAS